MLATTKDLAQERQRIESSLKSVLSLSGWLMLFISIVFTTTLLLAMRDAAQTSPFAVAAIVACILLAVDLLIETDWMSPSRIKTYQRAYWTNREKIARD